LAQCRRGGWGARAISFYARSGKPLEIDPRVECHLGSLAHHEGFHEEFTRRSKTLTVPPPGAPKGAETTAMLFRALLASGQITIRTIDGWRNFAERTFDQMIDLAA
jgi:hypothetical protein